MAPRRTWARRVKPKSRTNAGSGGGEAKFKQGSWDERSEPVDVRTMPGGKTTKEERGTGDACASERGRRTARGYGGDWMGSRVGERRAGRFTQRKEKIEGGKAKGLTKLADSRTLMREGEVWGGHCLRDGRATIALEKKKKENVNAEG